MDGHSREGGSPVDPVRINIECTSLLSTTLVNASSARIESALG